MLPLRSRGYLVCKLHHECVSHLPRKYSVTRVEKEFQVNETTYLDSNRVCVGSDCCSKVCMLEVACIDDARFTYIFANRPKKAMISLPNLCPARAAKPK